MSMKELLTRSTIVKLKNGMILSVFKKKDKCSGFQFGEIFIPIETYRDDLTSIITDENDVKFFYKIKYADELAKDISRYIFGITDYFPNIEWVPINKLSEDDSMNTNKNKQITKDMLRVGDVVKIQSGDLLIIISNSIKGGLCTWSSRTRKSGFNGGCTGIDSYSDDLKYIFRDSRSGKEYDIIAVFKGSEPGRNTHAIYEYIFNVSDKLPEINWDWELEKEMTKEEIENILGYKIKIV